MTLSVDLVISGEDETTGMWDMSFSNDGESWSDWENWSLFKQDWHLSGFGGNGDFGEKTVYLRGRYRVGNIAVTVSSLEYVPVFVRLVIDPVNVTIRPGRTKQFSVVAYDKDDNEMPEGTLDFKWEVEGGVGTVDEGGLFSARKAATLDITGEIIVNATMNGLTVIDRTSITIRGAAEEEDSIIKRSIGKVCVFAILGIIFLAMAFIAYVIFRKRHGKNGMGDAPLPVDCVPKVSGEVPEETVEGEVEGEQQGVADGNKADDEGKGISLFYEIWEDYNLPILEPIGRYLPPDDMLLLPPPKDKKMEQKSEINVHTLITEIIEQWEGDTPKAAGKNKNYKKNTTAVKRKGFHSRGKHRKETSRETDEN